MSLYTREKHYLEEEYFYRLIDELASIDYSGSLSPHFFNEPFADHRLPELIRYAADKLPHARILIFTNTTLLTTELFRKMPNHRIDSYIVTTDNRIIEKSCTRLLNQLDPFEQSKIQTRSVSDCGLYNRGGLVSTIPYTSRIEKCVIPEQYCIINAWGDVVLCYNDFFSENAFGNIKNESLMDTWNRPEFTQIRQQIAEGVFDLPLCQRCEANFQ